MKKILSIIIFIGINFIFSDTTIIAFDNIHQFFGNSGNQRTILDSVQLPISNEIFSEIIMNVYLECPNNGCDPWDRKANISIKQYDQWFEIGRYVTPYGIGCSWSYDVTDYRSILKGNIEIKSYIDTWVEPGWLVTVEFNFISGTPFTPNTTLRNIWNYDYVVYGDSTNPVNIASIQEYIPQDAQYVKLRITTTGHGQGNTENAAEFSYKIHELFIDSEYSIFHDFWRSDCEYNDCSPQFGTWQYDRAGFCPGDKVIPQDFSLSGYYEPGETIMLDYILEDYFNECSPNNSNCIDGQTCSSCDYNNNGHTEPFYFISSHLIVYSEKYHSNADNFIFILEQDTLTNNIQIYYENYVPVYGIQFTIDISLLNGYNNSDIEFFSANGGRAENLDWTFSINNNGTLIGLSQDLGVPLPPGEGILTEINWNGNELEDLSGQITLSDVNISGYFGSELSYEIGNPISYNSNLNILDTKISPMIFNLYEPFPNPFNSLVQIKFQLFSNEKVSLYIYNLKGELIEFLINNKNFSSGNYTYEWDGEYISSGVYFVVLKSANMIETKKIILLK